MVAPAVRRAVLSLESSVHECGAPKQEHCSLSCAVLWVRGRLSTMSTVRGARERARVEVTAAIKDEARNQLAAEGAAKLSLRAVARELGMASSALYRYFPSRDDLLTALIVDAYDAVGEAAETAWAGARDAAATHPARWVAVACAVRDRALAHPH